MDNKKEISKNIQTKSISTKPVQVETPKPSVKTFTESPPTNNKTKKGEK